MPKLSEVHESFFAQSAPAIRGSLLVKSRAEFFILAAVRRPSPVESYEGLRLCLTITLDPATVKDAPAGQVDDSGNSTYTLWLNLNAQREVIADWFAKHENTAPVGPCRLIPSPKAAGTYLLVDSE